MTIQNSTPFTVQLQKLDELYHTAPLPEYEAALATVAKYLEQTLPEFTIAYAEIATIGTDRQAHGGMRHVLMPMERNNQ